MMLLLKKFLPAAELLRAEAGIEAGINQMLDGEDYATLFGVHCSYCIAQLRICETRLLHFMSDSEAAIRVPDFASLGLDTDVATLLSSRWNEVQKCIDGQAYLAAIILLGSLLECLLFGVLQQRIASVEQCPIAPRDRKTEELRDLSKWTLSEMIDVAHSLGWIDLDVKKFSGSLREFRNLVHPRKQIEVQTQPDEDTCHISWLVVQAVCNDLCSRNNG